MSSRGPTEPPRKKTKPPSANSVEKVAYDQFTLTQIGFNSSRARINPLHHFHRSSSHAATKEVSGKKTDNITRRDQAIPAVSLHQELDDSSSSGSNCSSSSVPFGGKVNTFLRYIDEENPSGWIQFCLDMYQAPNGDAYQKDALFNLAINTIAELLNYIPQCTQTGAIKNGYEPGNYLTKDVMTKQQFHKILVEVQGDCAQATKKALSNIRLATLDAKRKIDTIVKEQEEIINTCFAKQNWGQDRTEEDK